MTEDEIRAFVNEATEITGDRVSVTERIVQRWLQDREDAIEEGVDRVYDGMRDSWNGE